MKNQFRVHYTVEEARALLPRIRGWLEEIRGERRRLEDIESQLAALLQSGADVGGPLANQRVRGTAAIQKLLGEFNGRGILIKDLDRGLLDFPAVLGGREVLLCWEEDEADIEFWHDIEAGYAGRERLEGPDQ